MDATSASMAGGTVILDVEHANGSEHPEITQPRVLSSGTAEVWVQTYDDVFTAEQVGLAPAHCRAAQTLNQEYQTTNLKVIHAIIIITSALMSKTKESKAL